MTTIAEVKLWGTTIGAIALDDNQPVASFQYDTGFMQSGIEIAPVMMPLSNQVYSFPMLNPQSFHGLPGLLADSLPDKFGNALIDAWLSRQGRSPESFNAVERLCYTGNRGMGALEFHPVAGPKPSKNQTLQVDRLVELASSILSERGSLQAELTTDSMADILRVGTSAGGARAKAVIAWNPTTNEVRSGQLQADPGFEHWLIKFDGVTNNRDKEAADPKGYGAIEYAYYRMATDCGIEMSDCRLLEEGGRRHFMTKRFDRLPNGDKLHTQSLAALLHLDFYQAGAYAYEQMFELIKRLGLPRTALTQMFRRMTFNIIARNQDDHVKNIAFLMDRRGNWSLAPAYDVTYAYQPAGAWTSAHQMTLCGKRDGFTLDDFNDCGKLALLKRGEAKRIVREITETVSLWRNYADDANVTPAQRGKVQSALRLEVA